jgi:LmbE family N-acetylglucosaminyl deacetylase
MAKWAAQGRSVHVLIMADGEGARPDATTEKIVDRLRAALAAGEVLGCESVDRLGFADQHMDVAPLLDVVRRIEERIAEIRPTTVLTHHGGDLNVDHHVVHQAVVTACRPQPGHCVRELLYFEVPSSTEWATPCTFAPNYFVDVAQWLTKKGDALNCYGSEMRRFPHPRSFEAVSALAVWRGATAGYHAAEAFMVGRVLA